MYVSLYCSLALFIFGLTRYSYSNIETDPILWQCSINLFCNSRFRTLHRNQICIKTCMNRCFMSAKVLWKFGELQNVAKKRPVSDPSSLFPLTLKNIGLKDDIIIFNILYKLIVLNKLNQLEYNHFLSSIDQGQKSAAIRFRLVFWKSNQMCGP